VDLIQDSDGGYDLVLFLPCKSFLSGAIMKMKLHFSESLYVSCSSISVRLLRVVLDCQFLKHGNVEISITSSSSNSWYSHLSLYRSF
jgi:hypothetical protein